jgi:hypothetical protein
MSERLDDWMEAYLEAWTSNDEHDIAALFTPDAVYDPQTAHGEQHGLAEIVEWWQDIDDKPNNWDFEWMPLVETEDIAVVTGRTRYLSPPATYRNLFVIRFDEDGRCTDFTEWWIEEEGGVEEE